MDIDRIVLPIIALLSAKTALEDRVQVLNAGADDYLVKPFAKEEVIARVTWQQSFCGGC